MSSIQGSPLSPRAPRVAKLIKGKSRIITPGCTAHICFGDTMFFGRVLLEIRLLLKDHQVVRWGPAFPHVVMGVLHMIHPYFRCFECQRTMLVLTWICARVEDIDERLQVSDNVVAGIG